MYRIKYYSITKAILPFLTTGLELGISMLNKIKQAQKDKCLIIYTYVQSEKVDLEVESRIVVTKG